MVRREGDPRSTGRPAERATPDCATAAGARPAPVSVGAPGSRPQAADVVADLNLVLRGWGNYFRTGNAAKRFNQLDGYVYRRLKALRVKRKGRQLRAGEAASWTRESFWNLGLYRLRGTVRYPEQPFWKEAA
jgi:Group II intron, maturase-specific domain